MKSKSHIVIRLMVPLSVIISLLVVFMVIMLYQQHLARLDGRTALVSENVNHDFNLLVEEQTRSLNAFLQDVATDEKSRVGLRKHNPDELFTSWNGLYQLLHREWNLTHFYFSDLKRMCLVRIHKPESKGGHFDRFTICEAERTGKSSSGLELGKFAWLTLRTVVPVYDGKIRLGYVELGKEIEDILHTVQSQNRDVEVALLIHKRDIKQEAWEEGMRTLKRVPNWNLLPHSVVSYSSNETLFEEFLPLVRKGNGDFRNVEFNNTVYAHKKFWRLSSITVNDASGKYVADLFVMNDITSIITAFNRTVIIAGAIAALLLGLLWSSIYLLLKRTVKRIQAQQKVLEESEDHHRLLFAESPTAYLVLRDGIVIDCNHASEVLFRGDRSRIVGLSYCELTSDCQPDGSLSSAVSHEKNATVLQHGALVSEWQYRRLDGDLFPAEVSMILSSDNGEQVLLVNVHDLTERKQAEETITVERTRLSNIIEGTHVGTWEWNVTSGEMVCNELWAEMIGYTIEALESVTHTQWMELIHSEDRSLVNDTLALHFSGELDYYECEYRIRHKRGGVVWILSRGKVASWGEDGKPLVMMGTNQNVTIRKKTDEAMVQAQTMAHIGNWELNLMYNTLYWSEEIFRIFEIDSTKFEATYEAFLNAIHPDDREMVNNAYTLSLTERKPYSIDHRLQMPDGRIKYVHEHCESFFDDDGKPLRSVGTVQDITERVESELASRDISLRLSLATQAANVGVWDYDIVHGTLVWDDQMYALYGLTPHTDSVAYDLWRLGIHPDDLHREQQEIELAMSGERDFNTEFRVVWPDGSIHFIRALATVLRDADGKPIRMIGTNWDISEQKITEESLRLAKIQAETANNEKSSFLANMSHEIRTPMNAVLGLGRLLEDTPLNTVQYDYLKKINNSSKLLLGVINDILDFSKIEAGKLELDFQPFQLEELVEQVKMLFVSTIMQKGLELILDISPDVPRTVVGDSLRLGQVLTNLIGNAVKFTESGHVTLHINSVIDVSLPKNYRSVRFSVEDSGIGMSSEQVERLFKPFSQADSSTTRKYGGSGLGLVISSRLVESMGGILEVNSIVDDGSEFFFTLPLELGSHELGISDCPHILAENTPFLIVDEQRILRDILRTNLESWMAYVEEASCGTEAIAKVLAADRRGNPFQFIVLDSKMSGEMGGTEMILEIQKLYKSGVMQGAELPVFLISTYDHAELPAETTMNNAVYLNKPVTASDLFNGIMLSAHNTIEPIRKTLEHDIPQFVGSTILLVEDNEINQEVGSLFIKKTGAKVVIANNGAEALEKLEMQQIDLVLMDLQMPIMDGFTATREIRRREAESDFPAHIPIIALSAAVMEDDHARSHDAGVDGHIAKPIEEKELYKVMSKFLKSASHIHVTNSLVSELPTTFPELKGFDLAQGLSVSKGDVSFYCKLLRLFNSQLAEEFEDFCDSVNSYTDTEIESKAHKLKGAAATVGAVTIASYAEQLELAGRNSTTISQSTINALRTSINEAKSSMVPFVGFSVNQVESVPKDRGVQLLLELKENLSECKWVDDKLLQSCCAYLSHHCSLVDVERLKSAIEGFQFEQALLLLNSIMEIRDGITCA